MTDKSMRSQKLPLLGSNQDSPDPESAERYGFRGNASYIVGVKAQGSAVAHTKAHTVPDTPDSRSRFLCTVSRLLLEGEPRGWT